jgi:hypothetical protein
MVHLNSNRHVRYFSVTCRMTIVYVTKFFFVENENKHTQFLVHTNNLLCCFSVEGLNVTCSSESFRFVTP